MSEQNIFDSISEDLKKKLKNCKTEEELGQILKDADLKLDEDMLKAVAGGIDTPLEGICRRDQCQFKCMVDNSQPLCPSNCPINA